MHGVISQDAQTAAAVYSVAMVGTLITWLFVLGCVGLGLALVDRLQRSLDPALRIALAGSIVLGLVGTSLLFFGLAGALQVGLGVVSAAALAGLALLVKGRPALRMPAGSSALFLVPIAAALLLALFGVLAPSDTLDWDSLAYHLAVPKIWLAQNRVAPIPFIHHSNFPFAVDNLHLLGLWWGGEQAAKAFQWSFYLLGILGAFGFARARYGDKAAWWSATAFATIPIAIWEAGTGYVDVANGVYGGLGVLLAGAWLQDRCASEGEGDWGGLLLAGLMLGLCAGSKFTGLQLIACAGLALLLLSSRLVPKLIVPGVAALGLAVVLASPWLVKNAAWTGNPVYPFFFEKLGGKGWDQKRADIYKNEQQTFGAGRAKVDPVYTLNPLQPTRFGHAALGLVYQPGRYVNPGQTEGSGNPLGAVGLASIAAMLAWLFSGRARKLEALVLLTVGLNLGLWFFLSEQSRYLMPLIFPLAVLAGAAVARLRTGPLVAASVALQACLALFAHYQLRAVSQIEVVLGKVDATEFRRKTVSFAEPAAYMNENLGKDSRVALYDEVFGFLLDVPYAWANPGHSTDLPNEAESGAVYVKAMKGLGFTHIYLNLSPMVKEQTLAQELAAATGLTGAPVPLSPERRAQLGADWQQRFSLLIAEAAEQGLIRPAKSFRRSALFEIL